MVGGAAAAPAPALSLSLFQGNSDGHRQGAYRKEFLLPFFFFFFFDYFDI
jgi:hypothetical protein